LQRFNFLNFRATRQSLRGFWMKDVIWDLIVIDNNWFLKVRCLFTRYSHRSEPVRTIQDFLSSTTSENPTILEYDANPILRAFDGCQSIRRSPFSALLLLSATLITSRFFCGLCTGIRPSLRHDLFTPAFLHCIDRRYHHGIESFFALR
jgi:hypothetical protein